MISSLVKLKNNPRNEHYFPGKEGDRNALQPLIDIIGGSARIEEIKKAFGFDIIEILSKLQAYEKQPQELGKFDV